MRVPAVDGMAVNAMSDLRRAEDRLSLSRARPARAFRTARTPSTARRAGDRHRGAVHAGARRLRRAPRTARRTEFRLRAGQPLPARCDRERRGRFKGIAVVPNDDRDDELARVARARHRRRGVQRDVPRRRLLLGDTARLLAKLARARHVRVAAGPARPARRARAAARALRRARADRPLRPSDARRGTRPAGIPGAAAARAHEARVRQAVGLCQIFAATRTRTRMRGPTSTRCSTRSRPIDCLWASDWPFLRAPRARRLRAAAEARRAPRSRTRPIGARCYGKRRGVCWASGRVFVSLIEFRR